MASVSPDIGTFPNRSASSTRAVEAALAFLRSHAPGVLVESARTEGFAIETAKGKADASGLAPWQIRRAKTLFEARLADGIGVDEVASACGLSRSHFSHGFRISTGLSPHNWLIRRRVEKACEILRSQRTSLCEVALACGFSDQSHLTRLFHRTMGMTPRAWRRLNWPEQRAV